MPKPNSTVQRCPLSFGAQIAALTMWLRMNAFEGSHYHSNILCIVPPSYWRLSKISWWSVALLKQWPATTL